jgi:hypothetical protein
MGDSILNFLHLKVRFGTQGSDDIETVRVQADDFLVLQDDDPVGVGGEGLGVTREEVFSLSNANHQWTSASCPDHKSGKVGMNHGDS